MKKVFYSLIFVFILSFAIFAFNIKEVTACETFSNSSIYNLKPGTGIDGLTSSTSNDEVTSPLAQMNMRTYFQNLYEYSPANLGVSCGYVSLVQYLSYLDTFYNDEIIPNQYEDGNKNATTLEEALSSSPGVKRNEGLENHFSSVLDYYTTDFQMYLIYLYFNNSDDSEFLSINMNEYEAFEEDIFNDCGLSFMCENNEGLLTGDNLEIEEDIKDLLDAGIPVIMQIGVYSPEDDFIYGNHSVVAYYYDEDGIHANFGWGEYDTDTIINVKHNGEGFYDIICAGYFLTDDEYETHSNNYSYTVNGVNSPYCGCGKSNIVTINYKDKGGSVFSGSNPTNQPIVYQCKTEGVVLYTPTHAEREFLGWHLDEDCLDANITEIPAGWYDELTLYAEWSLVIVPYTIDVDTPWYGNIYTFGDILVSAQTTPNTNSGVFHVKVSQDETTDVFNSGDYDIYRIEIRLSRTAMLTADSGTFMSEDNITCVWVGWTDSVEILASRICNVEYLRVDLAY